MKISIITAAYNSAQTIGDTLQSVAKQCYPQVEHIIVDGMSKDDTMSIVQQYAHVAKSVSERDKGIYDAMNKGIGMATGEVIGILNSDDIYINEEVLQKVMNRFADESVDLVYGDLQYVQQHNLDKVTRRWIAGNYTKKSFYYGWMPPHPSFFVRKRVYDKLGLFSLDLRTAADYEIIIRFMLKHERRAVYLPEVLVKMRAGGASNASLRQRLKANKEDRRAWKMNGLRPNPFTLILKPLRKINQFLIK